MNRFPQSARLTALVSTFGLTAVGALDYATGYDIRLFPLYFLPIALAAWRLPRWPALGFAALGTVTWLVSNALAGRTDPPLITAINFASQLVAFAVVGYLVAELRHRLLREQLLSRQDPLTRLPNSRAFYEHGERILALARRAARPVTLAYVDLDDFKRINDERGHHEGDRALTETAVVLAQLLRESDFAARLGGDEFAILLPDADALAARTSLERLHREMLSRMRHNAWPVSVSIGAVTYREAPARLADAVHDADREMYRAKADGKNRVVVIEAAIDSDVSSSAATPHADARTGDLVERAAHRVLH